MNDTYCISESALDKVRSEYNVAFEQANPGRLHWYEWLKQEHGVVNLVVEIHGSDWRYRTEFDNEKAATAFLLKWS